CIIFSVFGAEYYLIEDLCVSAHCEWFYSIYSTALRLAVTKFFLFSKFHLLLVKLKPFGLFAYYVFIISFLMLISKETLF
ncbi:MAG: hypothetical protein KDC06_04425, partial [Chitinophagaceae bacterium]|nr:hypothetical protein [Chitinophagaceae bacterium]